MKTLKCAGSFFYYAARVVCVVIGLPFVIACGAVFAAIMIPMIVVATVKWGFTGTWELD